MARASDEASQKRQINRLSICHASCEAPDLSSIKNVAYAIYLIKKPVVGCQVLIVTGFNSYWARYSGLAVVFFPVAYPTWVKYMSKVFLASMGNHHPNPLPVSRTSKATKAHLLLPRILLITLPNEPKMVLEAQGYKPEFLPLFIRRRFPPLAP